VLDEVGEALLVVVLLQRAGVDRQPHRGAILGLAVGQDVIGEAVGQRAALHLGPQRQRLLGVGRRRGAVGRRGRIGGRGGVVVGGRRGGLLRAAAREGGEDGEQAEERAHEASDASGRSELQESPRAGVAGVNWQRWFAG
jgi:hypothetical protein